MKPAVRRRINISPNKSSPIKDLTDSDSDQNLPTTVIPINSAKDSELPELHRFPNIQLEEDQYYAVDYIDTFYVGRIICFNKQTIKMKYMRRNAEGNYDWPTRDDIDDVEKHMIFDGPLVIEGTLPFKLKTDLHSLWVKFTKLRKSLI